MQDETENQEEGEAEGGKDEEEKEEEELPEEAPVDPGRPRKLQAAPKGPGRRQDT